MEDRELLEAAAKAAGMRVTWDGDNPPYPRATVDGHRNPAWNPLADDGDALRLAVDLRLTVLESSVRTPAGDVHNVFPGEAKDRFAATRLAIVRAAAALSKGA